MMRREIKNFVEYDNRYSRTRSDSTPFYILPSARKTFGEGPLDIRHPNHLMLIWYLWGMWWMRVDHGTAMSDVIQCPRSWEIT